MRLLLLTLCIILFGGNTLRLEAKNAKEYNDRCGSETDRISLRKEIS